MMKRLVLPIILLACGVAHDATAATEAFESKRTACARDDLNACVIVGMMHEAGVAPNASPIAAGAVYAKACDGDHARGCTALAMSREEAGRAEQARNLYRKACDLEDMFACSRLGLMVYAYKRRGTDVEQAFQLWRWACVHDEPLGCALAKTKDRPDGGEV